MAIKSENDRSIETGNLPHVINLGADLPYISMKLSMGQKGFYLFMWFCFNTTTEQRVKNEKEIKIKSKSKYKRENEKENSPRKCVTNFDFWQLSLSLSLSQGELSLIGEKRTLIDFCMYIFKSEYAV